jgi:hypothetical protein
LLLFACPRFSYATFVSSANFNLALSKLNGTGVMSASEAAAVMQNYWNGTTNSITAFSSAVPGLFQFGLTNAVGLNFTVMVSTNLVDWGELPDASPQFLFSDPAATNAPTRFYRLRWP